MLQIRDKSAKAGPGKPPLPEPRVPCSLAVKWSHLLQAGPKSGLSESRYSGLGWIGALDTRVLALT